jgi:NAD(P)-dependent dehydrogenase (short-subunit alcohol dehydrogenase family)
MTSNSPDARTALVTGGGSGIGRAIAVAMAERGLDVLVTGRRPDALAGTAALHPRIRTHVADVSDPAGAATVVAAAASRRLDVLVNNAGVTAVTPLGRIDADDAQRLWTTNVLGPTMLTQVALPLLVAARGVVVNVSSTFAKKPAPQISMYGATKAALEQLTRSWALELAPDGVRVNAVAPGPVASEALQSAGLSSQQIAQVEAEERAQIPLGRRGRPEDVASWVVALAEPDAWVTGQVVAIDGGYALT